MTHLDSLMAEFYIDLGWHLEPAPGYGKAIAGQWRCQTGEAAPTAKASAGSQINARKARLLHGCPRRRHAKVSGHSEHAYQSLDCESRHERLT